MTLFQQTEREAEVILLDYQATLVDNFNERNAYIAKHGRNNYAKWINDGERLRAWLLEKCEGKRVILITARPDKYKQMTLDKIMRETGFKIEESYFNDRGQKPEDFKKRIMIEKVFPKYGEVAYLALESNIRTREMYKSIGIKAIRVDSHDKDIFILPKV